MNYIIDEQAECECVERAIQLLAEHRKETIKTLDCDGGDFWYICQSEGKCPRHGEGIVSIDLKSKTGEY